MISDNEFNKILTKRFSGKVKINGEVIDMSSMSRNQLYDLGKKIESLPKSVTNNQAKSFKRAILEKKLSMYSNDKIILGGKKVYKDLQNKYPSLNIENISVQTSSGGFNLKPYIKL